MSNKHVISDLYQMQSLPLNAKISMTQRRIREWVDEYGEDGVYISFSGGKDSTVLLDIARKLYPNIKAIYDEGGCFDGGRVYFDRNGVDQEGEERANWIDAVWCDGMNRDGLPAAWTYKTDIPCEHFDIWEDGEIYCVGLVFSIEDLK